MTPPKRNIPGRPKNTYRKTKAKKKVKLEPQSLIDEALGVTKPELPSRKEQAVERLFPDCGVSSTSVLEILCDFMDTWMNSDPDFESVLAAVPRIPLGEAKILAEQAWFPSPSRRICADDRLTALAMGFIVLLSANHRERKHLYDTLFDPHPFRIERIREALEDLMAGHKSKI